MPETTTAGATPAEGAATGTEGTATGTTATDATGNGSNETGASTTTAEGSSSSGTEGEGKAKDGEPDLSGANNPDAVKKAIQAERDRAEAADRKAKALQKQIDEAAREKMSEDERLKADLGDFQGRAEKAEGTLERLRVAVDAKLLPETATLDQYLEVAGRLQGSNADELKQDAERLRPLFNTAPATGAAAAGADGGDGGNANGGSATGSWDGGARTGGAAPSTEGTGLFPHLYETKK